MKSCALVPDATFAPKSNVVPEARVACDTARARRVGVVASIESAKLTKARIPAQAADDALVFAEAVERIAAHADKAAFATVFTYYAPRVKGYLLRLGLDGSQAEELCQEVMVAVWRKAATFDRRQASVATWIFRIARNRRIDAFRREQTARIDAHEPMFQPQPQAAPDAAAEASEREAQIRCALADLPEDQRALVRDHFYEDLSHSQIADKTGLPLGTVKSRLRLAFAKLKLRLAEEDVSEIGASGS